MRVSPWGNYMKISLIGMSNSGKTFLAKKLVGFRYFGCDEFIQEKLRKKYRLDEIDVAKWMGQPYEERYVMNSKEYLKFEKYGIKEILAYLAKSPKDEKIVVDTTGSIIYLDEKIINSLKKFTVFVYLKTPISIEQLYQNYLKKPKPVIWGNCFSWKKGQTELEALAECYPKLLSFRKKKYKKYADVTIDCSLLLDRNFTVRKFMNLVFGV